MGNYLYTYPVHDAAFSIKTRSKPITAGKQCIFILRSAGYAMSWNSLSIYTHLLQSGSKYRITVDTVLEYHCLVNDFIGSMGSI